MCPKLDIKYCVKFILYSEVGTGRITGIVRIDRDIFKRICNGYDIIAVTQSGVGSFPNLEKPN